MLFALISTNLPAFLICMTIKVTEGIDFGRHGAIG